MLGSPILRMTRQLKSKFTEEKTMRGHQKRAAFRELIDQLLADDTVQLSAEATAQLAAAKVALEKKVRLAAIANDLFPVLLKERSRLSNQKLEALFEFTQKVSWKERLGVVYPVPDPNRTKY